MIKTNYETDEDIFFLQQILMRAVMSTDNVFEMTDPAVAEYRKMVLATRAKIFEYLGMEDPNQSIIKLMQNNNEQPSEPKIIIPVN